MGDCTVMGQPITGTQTPSGLRNGGLVTEVTLSDSVWTALPATPLANRNALAVQNFSGLQIKINYADTIPGYVGMVVSGTGGERQYDVTDAIVIYAKSQSGTPVVTVEEIA